MHLHILRNNERTKNRNGNSMVYRREDLLHKAIRTAEKRAPSLGSLV